MVSEVAVFGGGCFGCTEAIYQRLTGVIDVSPGFAGGTIPNPTYEQVVSGRTGHAEVIRVEYDPTEVKFRDLLTVFFAVHDPTTLNRQGADVGSQYRSIILYTNDGEKREAEAYIKEINESNTMGAPVVTEVKLLDMFYPAEAYHDQYALRNPEQPYVQVVINPKLEKVHKKFAELLKLPAKAGF